MRAHRRRNTDEELLLKISFPGLISFGGFRKIEVLRDRSVTPINLSLSLVQHITELSF
jgi:hypothetical protein